MGHKTKDERDQEKRSVTQIVADASRPAKELIQRLPDDITTIAPPEPRQIVPGILPCASTVLAAAGHTGKSVNLIFAGLKIALGLSLFGREVRQGKVLYVHGEDSSNDVARLVHYVSRNASDMLFRPKDIADNFLPLNAAALSGMSSLLSQQDGLWYPGGAFGVIEEIIADGGFSAVILDTISSLGYSEGGLNDAASVYHRECNRQAEQHDLCWIGSHHVGQTKAENRDIGMYALRGGTGISDNARCVIQLQHHDAAKHIADKAFAAPFNINDDTYAIRWHVIKHKWSDLRADLPLWVEGQAYECTDYKELTGDRLAEAKRVQRKQTVSDKIQADTALMFDALEALDGNAPTVKNIHKAANVFRKIGVNAVRDTLTEMTANGDITEEKIRVKGKRGPPSTHYRLKRYGED